MHPARNIITISSSFSLVPDASSSITVPLTKKFSLAGHFADMADSCRFGIAITRWLITHANNAVPAIVTYTVR